MVSGVSIAGILFSILVSLALPVGFSIFFIVRYKIHFRSVLIGAAVFFLFSLVLESIMHYFVLSAIPSTKAFFQNPWAYGVYGGLAAGVFEETGRFVAFTLLLRKFLEWKDGVAYGIGHGGFEAIIIGALGNVNNLVYAILINMGLFDTTIAKAAGSVNADVIMNAKQTLIATAPYMFYIAGIERMMAFTLQIALSLLVLYGVRSRKPIFLLYAILIHAAVDFPAALSQRGLVSIWAVEGIVFVVFLLSLLFIVRARRLFASPLAEKPAL